MYKFQPSNYNNFFKHLLVFKLNTNNHILITTIEKNVNNPSI